MAVEWDVRKNASNLRKHGIGFPDAAGIFDGPVLEARDEREPQEDRIVAFGAVGLRVMVVVYTWRGDKRRMISARKATSGETKAYFQALRRQTVV